MHQECSQCLFCEEVEDEVYMNCQAKQKLVMGAGKACDFFEPKGCVCEECTMKDIYTNTTEQTREKKIVPTLFAAYGEPDDPPHITTKGQCNCGACQEETKRVYDYVKANVPIDDSCCNANSYSKLNNFGDEDYEPCDCDECSDMDYEDWTQAEFYMDDIERSTSEVLETLAFLGEETTTRDVLAAVLGLEATISTLKRFLLEYEGE